MALTDVKRYYYTMLKQYIEMKDNIADFEQAVRDGHITEEQLEVAKEDVAVVEANYQRLSYIMYLFELPKNKKKKLKYIRNRANMKLENSFSKQKADLDSVVNENTSMITHLRTELKNLTESDGTK